MKTIAMYDVTGIQDFVFASGKVKENVGASIIVQKVFEEYLNKAIEKTCNNSRTRWNQYPDFQICSGPKFQTEVIYSGGGNAMVVYRDREIAINVTKELSYEILEKTGGTLKFAVAYQNTECKDYLNDRDGLVRKLKINKYRIVHQTPLLGIGITRQGDTDGLPAMIPVKEDNTQKYLSKSAYFKRKTWEKEKKYFDRLLANTTDYDFPLEFDDLGQKTGENYIAVVHIDGNNMGKVLNELLESDRTAEYQQSIQTVREFSKQVDEKYNFVMEKMVRKLADGLKDNDFFYKKLEPVDKDKKLLLPIRPIVLSGDDVTFVCNGKIGIALAEEFLAELDHQPAILLNDSETKLSACAGVAIVKSHFPFYRAYQLAEELCKSAKMKGKTLAKMKNVEEIGNWLDFHIFQTGITTNLNEIRDKFCQVPGMEPPNGIEYKEHGNVQMKVKQYNLLWRPWCVAGNCDEKYQWDAFIKAVYKKFEKEWKRSRLKKLESEMTRSANDAEIYIRECKSREFKLPECSGSYELYRERQTPYFDALELLDFYVTLPRSEEISHEN